MLKISNTFLTPLCPCCVAFLFNMFAEQARREKREDSRPVKERGAVSSVQLAKTVADSKKSSVQDGNGSEVFKRLFTTHETAQNLPKGNWVTFDPRYN